MKKMILIITVLFSSHSFAQVQGQEPKLKELMAIMGQQAQAMLIGMLYNDYQAITNAVAWVNNHQAPTGDLAAIKAELGLDVLRFKWYDTRAHNAANAIGEAALVKDMQTISKNYGIMIESCTKCHETFRDRLRKVLHK